MVKNNMKVESNKLFCFPIEQIIPAIIMLSICWSPVAVCWVSVVWCRSPAGWGSSCAEPPAAPSGAHTPPGTETVAIAKPPVLQPPLLSAGENISCWESIHSHLLYGGSCIRGCALASQTAQNIHFIWTSTSSTADLSKRSLSASCDICVNL